MTTQELMDGFIENPVIAAARDEAMFVKALASSSKLVFLLFGKLMELEQQCAALKAAGKLVFIHIDLIDGLKADQQGLQYIAEKIKPHGIITTRGASVRYAQELGLFTIQRIFMLDSSALTSGAGNVTNVSPDFVELLPGISPKAISLFAQKIHVPIIAGGLVLEKEDVFAALQAGAIAVSTSEEALWEMNG